MPPIRLFLLPRSGPRPAALRLVVYLDLFLAQLDLDDLLFFDDPLSKPDLLL